MLKVLSPDNGVPFLRPQKNNGRHSWEMVKPPKGQKGSPFPLCRKCGLVRGENHRARPRCSGVRLIHA